MKSKINQIEILSDIILLLKGFLLGIGIIIPGLSWATIALIIGAYKELINGICKFDLKFLSLILTAKIKDAVASIPIKPLFIIFTGAIISLISLYKTLNTLLSDKPVFISAFFFGVILAAIPIIGSLIKKWTIQKALITAILSICTVLFLNLTPIKTPDSFIFVFLSGFISISTLILPGISVSYILILLGKYPFLFNAIKEPNINVIAYFAIGVFIGVLSFVRIVNWSINKFYDTTIAAFLGLIIGSLYKLWPWKQILSAMILDSCSITLKHAIYLPTDFNNEFWIAIALIIAGIIFSFLISLLRVKSE
jgi:putative membrane protein